MEWEGAKGGRVDTNREGKDWRKDRTINVGSRGGKGAKVGRIDVEQETKRVEKEGD